MGRGGISGADSRPPALYRRRGNSPQWDSKASPMHLQQAPATMRMQVCTSGFFEDQSREAKAVRNVLPLMSSMPVVSAECAQPAACHPAPFPSKPAGCPRERRPQCCYRGEKTAGYRGA